MKKLFLLLPLLFLTIILTGCTVDNLDKIDDITAEQILEVIQVDEDGNTVVNTEVLGDYISQTENVTLSPEEIEGILFMLEEEKLARDVYAALYDKWNVPVFDNISQSEDTHKNAIQTLVEEYDLNMDFYNNEEGEFDNEILLGLYNDLVAQGGESLDAAYRVGAIIEEIDILDLEKYLEQTDNSDIIITYENLLRGSRNHLRSFTKNMANQGEAYTPQMLEADNYDTIVNSDMERGSSQGTRGGQGQRGGRK